jgi:26S proteasome regulatory subunit N11
MNTQLSFERLNQRAVAVVIDPIQSVRGKVVIDAFRLINPQLIMRGMEPRQTTSNIGHVAKPSITALLHGLNRHYYSITINYRKNELEQSMLLNLQKQKWVQGLKVEDFTKQEEDNLKVIDEMLTLSESYNKWIQEEMKKSKQEMIVSTVGKIDPKKRLEQDVDTLLTQNILQSLSSMIDTIIF